MSDQNEFVIIYHPQCKACQRLLRNIKEDNSMFKLVNILSIPNLPQGLKSVPAGITEGSIITGKKLFEKVESMLNGPVSVNIFGASNQAGFISGSANFKLNANFSTLEGGDNTDGFTGVPKFDENQTKTIDQLKLERD
jgi:predicted thioredoxin/glutaredoxin